jgi:Calpain family cysteine protease/RTX calcium-binding nonapeptide repeat (4 copies)
MHFDSLESRRLMTASLLNGTLTVDGRNGMNNIAVSQSGTTLRVNDNGAFSTFSTIHVNKIWVKGKDYDDTLSASGVTINTEIDGAGGNDVITTGSGNDTVYAGAGNDRIVSGPQTQRLVHGIGIIYDDKDFISGDAGNDTVTAGMGNDTIYGGAGDDQISADAGNDWVYAQDGNDVVRGGVGNDNLFGNGGNDALYGGAGTDGLYGGDGNDLLVSIGGGQNDYNLGEAGSDSFWVDTESTEIVADIAPAEAVAGHLHRVATFMPTTVFRNNGSVTNEVVSRELDGQSLQDPEVFSVDGSTPIYSRFSGRRLFSGAGPLMTDIRQGAVGDCYYLASLSAIAKANPDKIRQSVVDLGDGTFGVQFFRNNATPTFIRVDADLPTIGGGTCYDHIPSNGAMWAAVMEKAYAFFRRLDGKYASLSSGTAAETFGPLGVASGWSWRSPFQSGSDFLNQIQGELNHGKAVTLCTPPVVIGNNWVGSHCYAVDHVVFSSNGTATDIVLRNPWGTDREGSSLDGNDDGFVTISASDVYWSWVQVDSAFV